MNIPGFTAENSASNTLSHFQSETDQGFGIRKQDNQVYLQKPNWFNLPGTKCHARVYKWSSGNPIKEGYYDHNGFCCGKSADGSQHCVDCNDYDNPCDDGHSPSVRGSSPLLRDDLQVLDDYIEPPQRPRWGRYAWDYEQSRPQTVSIKRAGLSDSFLKCYDLCKDTGRGTRVCIRKCNGITGTTSSLSDYRLNRGN